MKVLLSFSSLLVAFYVTPLTGLPASTFWNDKHIAPLDLSVSYGVWSFPEEEHHTFSALVTSFPWMIPKPDRSIFKCLLLHRATHHYHTKWIPVFHLCTTLFVSLPPFNTFSINPSPVYYKQSKTERHTQACTFKIYPNIADSSNLKL